MPGVFVVLWSTGFIGAKYGLPYAEPLTFLLLRYAVVAALLGALAGVTRAPWPQTPRLAGHIAVSGLLVHAVYLGAVFVAIARGLPAGIVALVAGLQPLLTAAVAGRLLGERVSARQWVGLMLGLGGIAMVLGEKAAGGMESGFGAAEIAIAFLALFGITAGTLYQKRFCTGMDLRTGTLIQYIASAAATLPVALLLEDFRVEWSGRFVFALGWLVLVLSIGAISVLLTLIRRGEAARVASFFYLVPPVTALIAYALFDERLGAVALFGMAVAAAGVGLVVAKRS